MAQQASNNNNNNIPVEKQVIDDRENNLYVFECPNCNTFVQVEKSQVNCAIFRHAYFFQTVNGQQVLVGQLNPHAPKDMCDRLVAEGRVVGCGKPFQMVRQADGSYRATTCGYI